MNVIVHQHVAQNPHRESHSGIGHQLQEGSEVAIYLKDIGPAISTIY